MTVTRWWWLSFVDPSRPADDRFVGVAIVETTLDEEENALAIATDMRAQHGLPAPDLGECGIVAATQAAARLGCNPGGEVSGFPIPEEEEWRLPPMVLRNRLLTMVEMEMAGMDPRRVGDVP